MLVPTYREYAHEHSSEFRGVVSSTERLAETIDICTHKHKTAAGALRCAKQMCGKMARARQSYLEGQNRKRGKPLIEIL